MAGLVRRDIWELHKNQGPWNDTVHAYALAVGVLKKNEMARPPSWWWSHQTQIHGMTPDPKDGLRNQCQHSSWYFLPWHRMYLWHFEQIIRAAIAQIEEIDDSTKQSWALPYWNYCDPNHRKLPPAFAAATLKDGITPNPLLEPNRNPGVNDATSGLSLTDVDARGWWTETVFDAPGDGDSFGGPKTRWNHEGGPMGSLEATPHGMVHMFVGGQMSRFPTAASDPVFWLHHANVDRIWEVWGAAHPAQRQPLDPGWDLESFEFLNSAGVRKPGVSSTVVDTTLLGYTYEDTSPPHQSCFTQPGLMTVALNRGLQAFEMDEQTRRLRPQSLGASQAETVLGRGATELRIDLAQDDRLLVREGRPGPARVLMSVRDVRPSAPPTVAYSAYLLGSASRAPYHVGNIPLFGAYEALDSEDGHSVEYTFDITDVVNVMSVSGDWDPEHVDVRVAPSNPELAELVESVPEVSIGTFDISYQ